MKRFHQGFWLTLFCISVTGAAMAFVDSRQSAPPVPSQTTASQPFSLEARPVQDRILQGSDGSLAVALTLTGADIPADGFHKPEPVDLVIVLDRSGSMRGEKLDNAKMAVIHLMNYLSADDRMAVVTYANDIQTPVPLTGVNAATRDMVAGSMHRLQANGGTNLGGGLQRGLAILTDKATDGRRGKVILLSDGLANQGITDPYSLGAMAANGTEHNIGVSTVGVGYDFNELLMTTVADHGSGSYYFLENPQELAQVVKDEFASTRNVVASHVQLRIPLHDGIQLIGAGGYPIASESNFAIIRPGDLIAGHQRKLFLTFQLPTATERDFTLGDFQVSYAARGQKHNFASSQNFTVRCIADHREVVASIDKKSWSRQVVQEEYNRLKDKVASAIRQGKEEQALESIQEYETKNRNLNDTIGSAEVSDNLDRDVEELRLSVQQTFAGAPAAVAVKKKKQAKALQYESYQLRRDKK